MSEPATHERRKSPRKYLDQPLPIEDRNCGVEIGRVVDVSMDGLMVESHKEIPVNNIFQFTIMLPEQINGRTMLNLGADSLWCEQASDLRRYWAGFQIIELSPEDRTVLEALMAG
jgi:hypothetical protein